MMTKSATAVMIQFLGKYLCAGPSHVPAGRHTVVDNCFRTVFGQSALEMVRESASFGIRKRLGNYKRFRKRASVSDTMKMISETTTFLGNHGINTQMDLQRVPRLNFLVASALLGRVCCSIWQFNILPVVFCWHVPLRTME